MVDLETAPADAPATAETPQVDTMAARLAGITRSSDDPAASLARQRVHATLFGGAGSSRPRGSIGRFTLLERRGAGAMGEVFVAHDPVLDRKVAIKLVHHERSDSEPARARLLREAQALARLSHPHVVTVYESGTHEGRVYIAMELIAGVDLRALFRHERPWRRVVEVYADAARGLAAAHAVGLVHRDFKPENVMLGADGRVRVLDFGVARASETEPGPSESGGRSHVDLLTRPMTGSGVLLGTPAYMAPEQFRAGQTSPRSDQYSFCVALHESLHGQRPFVADSLQGLLEAQQAQQLRPPAGSEVPRGIDAVIARGLRADPEARFSTMDALVLALDACLSRHGRLRRGFALGGFTGLALLAGYVVASQPAAACLSGEAAIASVWSPERSAALTEVFAASDAADAAAIGQRVTGRVDTYAADWAQAHTDACASAQITGEQARRLSELRMACLSDARRDLDQTLRVLATGEPTVIFAGVQAVAALPDLRRCGDSEALLAAVPPPSDPEVAATVATLRARAAEVRALERAGLYPRALAEVEGLIADAAPVDYLPLRAELDVLAGQLEFNTARYDAAATALERGFWAAIDSGHDEVAATAAVHLTALVGGRQAALEAGLGWARQAEALIRRGHLPPALEIALHRGRARTLRTAGQPDRSRAELDAALALQQAAPEVDDLDAAKLLRELGSVAFDQGRADEAAELVTRALEHARVALGERHPEVGDAQRLLGITLYGVGRRLEALEAFNHALQIGELTHGPDHPNVADTLNNIGATLDELDRDAEAIAAYERALAIRQASLGEDHPDVAATLGNIAITLCKLGRLDEAELALRRTEAILRAVHGEQHPAVATNKLGIAHVTRMRGEYAAAAALAREAAAILAATLGPDHSDLAYAHGELTEILLEGGGDPAAAIEPARRALALRSGPSSDPLLHAESELRLGQALWLARQDLDEARQHLRAARAFYVANGPATNLEGVEGWLLAQHLVLDP